MATCDRLPRAALLATAILVPLLVGLWWQGRDHAEARPLPRPAPPPAGSLIALPAQTALERALALTVDGHRARARLIALVRERYARGVACVPPDGDLEKLEVRLSLAAEEGRVRIRFLTVEAPAGVGASAEILACARARLVGDVLVDDPALVWLSSLLPDQVTIGVHTCRGRD